MIIEPTMNDLQVREVIGGYREDISLALKWYVNDLKQSEGIARHRLMGYVPKFNTLKGEIEMLEETLQSPMFRAT